MNVNCRRERSGCYCAPVVVRMLYLLRLYSICLLPLGCPSRGGTWQHMNVMIPAVCACAANSAHFAAHEVLGCKSSGSSILHDIPQHRIAE